MCGVDRKGDCGSLGDYHVICSVFLFLFRSVVYTVDGQASIGIPESMPSMLLNNKYKESKGSLPKTPAK